MNLLIRTIAHCLLILMAGAALAQTAVPRQDHNVLRQGIEKFLSTQATGLPGQVNISVGAIDPRLNLASCPAPEAFLPNGSKAWGRTTVGMRCSAPTPWKIFVAATVSVQGEYVAAAVPLAQGHVIQSGDLTKIKGDLTLLPAGIITDPAQAMGYTVLRSLALGSPLRNDVLRGQKVVQQGQSVRVVSSGPGFKVSTEGKALSNATAGQAAQARTSNGQVVSGIAKMGGIIEMVY